jgi:nucleotide-binding universal stress UspA family protein
VPRAATGVFFDKMTPMLKTRHILLASHDTPGARAAEKTAFSLCRANSTLHHLIVVPDFWKGMQGDDWLNNAATRDIYADYVESQLEDEVRRHVRRMMKTAAKRKIRYRFEVIIGKPTDSLIARAKKGPVDLVVIGSPRPKGAVGLRSRMHPERLVEKMKTPLLIIPHPG